MICGRGTRLLIGLLLAIATLLPPRSLNAADSLVTTKERHFPTGPHSQFKTKGRFYPVALDGQRTTLAPKPRNAMPGSNLLFEDRDQSLTDLDYDKDLSWECRRGRFRQARDRLFITRLRRQVYGAALGGHWSLYDPGRLAIPGIVYVIRHQDAGRCQVYRGAFFVG